MVKATLPFDEKQRHEELIKFQILDTKEEESFNDLVELAALLCNTTSATISFIDKDRQWLKATINMERKESPRDLSLCGHTILQNEVMVIEDTLADDRFKDNPNVVDGAKIRFYAGAPIITSNGKKIGALCVIDQAPDKKLDTRQINGLKTLANQVSKLLELRLFNIQTAQKSKELIDAEKAIAQLNLLNTETKNDEIAYELHENIAQLIAAAKFKIERIQSNGPGSIESLDEVKDNLTLILNDVKKLSYAVTPTTFKGANYLDYIDRMLKNFKKLYNVQYTFTIQGDSVQYKSAIGLAFYRIIQYQLFFARTTEANNLHFNLNNSINASFVFEHNGKKELCESVEADLYLNNINTVAASINASFKNDPLKNTMQIQFQKEISANN